MLYSEQPRCSAVVAEMNQMGFAPIAPVSCAPRHAYRANHFCEMNLVFGNQERDRASPPPEIFFEYHQTYWNGCNGTYPLEDAEQLWRRPPPGVTVVRRSPKGAPEFFNQEWGQGVRKNHSFGRSFRCPQSCFPPHGMANATHMLGFTWAEAAKRHLFCPFW